MGMPLGKCGDSIGIIERPLLNSQVSMLCSKAYGAYNREHAAK